MNLALHKKHRDKVRETIRKEIAKIRDLSGGELSEFEIAHGIMDAVLQGVDSSAQVQGTTRLTHGFAQSYLDYTKEISDATPEPAPVFKGKSAECMVWDDINPLQPAAKVTYSDIQKASKGYLTTLPGPETVKAKMTKKHFNDGFYNFVVGGLVAKETVAAYGYELPQGYLWEDYSTYEYRIVKDDPAKPVKFHVCGNNKCLDMSIEPGNAFLVAGSYAALIGLSLEMAQKQTVNTKLVVTKVDNMDVLSFYLPLTEDLESHGDTTKNNAPSPYAPKTYALKNSAGKTVQAPFKTCLKDKDLQELGLWSMVLPMGVMWHSSNSPIDQPDWWYLDYAGSKPPVWDNF